MVHIIKAYLDMGITGIKPEIRRFAVGEETAYSYQLLCEKIAIIFPSLKGKDFSLCWKDTEDDYITMSSDEELAQAVANVEDGINKIYIIMPPSAANTLPKSLPQNPGELHTNVVCDGCNGEVRKYRYKCLQCEDYDLCHTCHTKDVHPGHDMVKITSPMPHQWLFPGWRRLYAHVFGRTWQGPCAGRGKGRFCQVNNSPGKPKSEENPVNKSDEDIAAREQNAEFLRNIGNTVAAFLDPLGISVNIDVEHPDGDRETCTSKQNEESEKPESPKTTASKNEVPDNSKTDQKSSPLSSNNNLKRSPESETTESVDNKNTTPVKEENSNDNIDSPGIAEGWTVVNGVNQKQNDHEETSEDDTPVTRKRKIPSSAFKIPVTDRPPVHPDPKIAKALNTMTSMGFDNEGGWLVHLLESKQGNIADVLDTLYPNAGNLGRM